MRGGRAALHPLEGDGLGRLRSRASRAIEAFGLDGPVDRWRALRAAIHEDVCTHGFDRELGSFVQAYGSKELDASLLLMPPVGFLPPRRSARARHDRGDRARAARRRLRAALRHRRRPTTGCRRAKARSSPAASGWPTRTCCSAASTRRGGCSSGCSRCATTSACCRGVRHANGRLVGNFPQAFSHVALVNTAHNLSRASKPVHQRSR